MTFLKNISFKKLSYRAYLVLLSLIAIYAIAGIVYFKWTVSSVSEPRASFLIQETKAPTNKPITLIEFIDYTCGYCKEIHPTIEELLNIRKDVRYIVRPVAFDEEVSEPILRYVLAAGIQGKFFEMHKAVLEYPEAQVPEEFFEQTAGLYGLDFKQMKTDAASKEVDKIIDSNLNALISAGVQATPSFIVNNTIYMPGDALPTLVDLINMIKNEE